MKIDTTVTDKQINKLLFTTITSKWMTVIESHQKLPVFSNFVCVCVCVCVCKGILGSLTHKKTQTFGWTSAFKQDKRDKNNRGYNSDPDCEIMLITTHNNKQLKCLVSSLIIFPYCHDHHLLSCRETHCHRLITALWFICYSYANYKCKDILKCHSRKSRHRWYY